ncbi:cell cycle transcriptional regulator TrcR [Fulvimarina sp. 2208YS6-2-32]|uniref:Cell cycle transcriptional regulator TrcR n=1 Tax=Fulvimarina uroteuthidis TaxID=3098149 RepID=A0ABU5I0J0_9HYPH|nr:cell cycle transcriptional regulator TrcR [Fulvimarina sp. 2208YS6-2-32]MDY8108324.1 cell cycle transcriptional regulator TrcR [Fulvimarina sp. 2208YS6-2-32]
MAQQLLMPKATAVWLVDNTSLSFEQIADFCLMHPLEIKAIADGESAQGIKGLDPIGNGQLTRADIENAEKNDKLKLKLAPPKVRVPEAKRKAPRYTPVSKRQDRPNAILWLVRNHAELDNAAISRLVGTTKNTIEAIRDRSHWNSANLVPMDPVTLGLCTQIDLDLEVEKAMRGLPQRPEDLAEEERLLSASQTENWLSSGPSMDKKPDEDQELDAAAVFAKLTSMKSKPDEDGDKDDR